MLTFIFLLSKTFPSVVLCYTISPKNARGRSRIAPIDRYCLQNCQEFIMSTMWRVNSCTAFVSAAFRLSVTWVRKREAANKTCLITNSWVLFPCLCCGIAVFTSRGQTFLHDANAASELIWSVKIRLCVYWVYLYTPSSSNRSGASY